MHVSNVPVQAGRPAAGAPCHTLRWVISTEGTGACYLSPNQSVFLTSKWKYFDTLTSLLILWKKKKKSCPSSCHTQSSHFLPKQRAPCTLRSVLKMVKQTGNSCARLGSKHVGLWVCALKYWLTVKGGSLCVGELVRPLSKVLMCPTNENEGNQT